MTSVASRNNLKDKSVMDNLKCQLCNNTFIKESYLKNHITNVHSENPYQCKICSQFFKSKPEFRSHLASQHFEEKKAFKCTYCQKQYSNAGNLKVHVLAVHDKLKIKCVLCKSRLAESL